MAKRYEIYVCEICGNIVEVLEGSDGDLVCCGQKMTLQRENTEEASLEKHVPVVERDGNKIKVKVGSVPHPMESAHYIQWIEVIENGKVKRTELTPGTTAEAKFRIGEGDFLVRAYCNLHGLWKNV